jgi:hypothetical protein
MGGLVKSSDRSGKPAPCRKQNLLFNFSGLCYSHLVKTCFKFLTVFLALILLLFMIDNSYNQSGAKMEFHTQKPALSTFLTSASLQFEVNEGQVSNDVKFLSRGRGYNLYLKDNSAQLALRSDNQNRVYANDLGLKFIGSNQKPAIAGVSETQSKSNYFIGDDSKKWKTNIANFERVKYKDIYHGIDLVFYGKQGVLEYDFIVSPGVNPAQIKIEIDGAENVRIDESGNLGIETRGELVEFRAPVIYQMEDNFKKSIDGRFCLNENNRVSFDLGPYDDALPLIIDPQLVYSTYLGKFANDHPYDIAVDEAGYSFIVGNTYGSTFPTTPESYKSPYMDNDVFVTKISPDGSKILYSAIIGGKDETDAYGDWGDYGHGIALDNEGNAIITGQTKTTNFPTVNAFQSERKDTDCYMGECGDAFVTKINATGSDLIFSTYLGGNYEDTGDAIAVDVDNNIYVTGEASWASGGNQFPTTPGVIDEEGSGSFICKFAPDGELKYSTFLTEGNNTSSIAADKFGNVYVAGRGGLDECPQYFTMRVVKLNSTGSAIIYTADECCNVVPQGIAVDDAGNCYVGGAVGTSEDLLPVTAGAYQSASAGDMDVFVAKWNPSGTSLLYCTYLGGTGYDYGKDIDIDKNGNVYITGFTKSTDYPIEAAVQEEYGGSFEDVFVAKINPNLSGKSSLVYSTYLGGSGYEQGEAIAVDANENAYVTGFTNSNDFPIKNAIDPEWNNQDAFVTRIGTANTPLIFDQVMRGNLPIATPLNPPATHQIVQQYRMMNATDTLFFTIEGRSSDGMAGLRLSNTRVAMSFPLKLMAKVLDPDNSSVGLFSLPNIHADNFGGRFNINKDGLYTIAVFAENASPGPYPATFQIHLSGNVGLPRKLINGEPEIVRGTRLDILFNHPAPRPQILAGADSSVAQTGLFKFANPVSIAPYAIAAMLPPTPSGYPVGEAIIRAADPVVLGHLRDNIIDRTTPTARTPEWTLPRIGSIVDFTQVPLPHSVEEWPPLPPLQGTICSVLWENDGLGVQLPLEVVNGTAQSIILDMGFSQEIVDGDGNDFKVFAPSGTYAVAAANTPYSMDFVSLSNSASGDQEFDLNSSGLSSARFVRIMASPSVTVDAVKSLNVFADAIRGDIGPAADMAEATILLRRMKAPETELDPFLELIAPDGSRLGENESGFGDVMSLDLSDAALIGIDLTQVGFHRFLGRGFHQVPDEQAFGSYFARLESGGPYDTDKIIISPKNEAETIAQKTGQIVSTQQRDSYLFEAKPGQNINIVLNALNENLDPIIELYDPEEFLIASNDKFVNRGKNSVVSIQLPDSSFVSLDVLPNPSTYRITVSAVHGSGSFTRDEEENINVYVKEAITGNYELKVFTGALEGPASLPPVVTSVTPQRVKTGTSNLEVKIKGENFQNGALVQLNGSGIDISSTKFVSATQLMCSIDVASDAGEGWYHITVINPDGQKKTGYNLLKVLDVVGNVQLLWDPPSTGEENAPPTNLSVGLGDGLTFTGFPNPSSISAMSPITEVEPNNSLEQAMVLSGELVLLNGNVETNDVGSITPIDDDIEDLYKVTTAEPGMSIALDSFMSDCDLYLLEQDGGLLFNSANRGATVSEEIAIQGLPNGTYYIGVSIYDPNPLGGNSTPYVLTAMGKFEGGGETAEVQKYNIYRSTVPDAKTTGLLVGSVDAPAVEYFDSAPYSSKFYYQISAVYVSGESQGSNEASLLVTQVQEEGNQQASNFEFYQNYPNPFNPTTSIEYDMPLPGFVKITISDVLGRHIKTVVNSNQAAGHYSTLWNATDDNNRPVAAGLYFCKMEAVNFVKVIKLALVK